jgi:hypothetical protein
MAKQKTPPRTEDEEESQRFIETAKGFEAAGELNLTEGEQRLDGLLGRMAPPKRPSHE